MNMLSKKELAIVFAALIILGWSMGVITVVIVGVK